MAIRTRQRITREKSKNGYLLVEASIAIFILSIIGYYTVTSLTAAQYAAAFGIKSQLADQFLENQAAIVRSAEINNDGSLVIPFGLPYAYDTSQKVYRNIPIISVTPNSDVAKVISLKNQYVADVYTQRTLVTKDKNGSNEDIWEYCIEVAFAKNVLGSKKERSYKKAKFVLRSTTS